MPDPTELAETDLDRLVVEVLREPPQACAARLAALRLEGGELAGQVERRLHLLGEYGLLVEPSARAPSPPLPKSIGGYQILRELGSGGMGIVYLAEQPTLRRVIALKVLHGWRVHFERARAVSPRGAGRCAARPSEPLRGLRGR